MCTCWNALDGAWLGNCWWSKAGGTPAATSSVHHSGLKTFSVELLILVNILVLFADIYIYFFLRFRAFLVFGFDFGFPVFFLSFFLFLCPVAPC